MNDTQLIDDYFFKRVSGEDQLIIQAKFLTDPQLGDKLYWQNCVYEIVTVYGRKKLKQEIVFAEEKLFSENRFKHFRDIVTNIFK